MPSLSRMVATLAILTIIDIVIVICTYSTIIVVIISLRAQVCLSIFLSLPLPFQMSFDVHFSAVSVPPPS